MSKRGRGAPQIFLVILDIRDEGGKLKAFADPDICPVKSDGNGLTTDVVAWVNRSDREMELVFQKSPFKNRRYKVKKHHGKFPKFKKKVPFGHHKYLVGALSVTSKKIRPMDPIEPSEADINIMLDEGDTET